MPKFSADLTMMFNEVMPTALRWPIWIFHLSAATGGGLLALQSLRAAVDALRVADAPQDML